MSNLARLTLALLFVLFLQQSPAWAGDVGADRADAVPKGLTDPRFRAAYKAAQIYNDRPSMDRTPLYIGINPRYRIPRNYIVNMSDWSDLDSGLATIKVTYPGFRPLTDVTKSCLQGPRGIHDAKCVSIRFSFSFGGVKRGGAAPPHGDDHRHRHFSDDDHFKNESKLFRSQVPKEGPAGFEMYETGPDNYRTETYRKKTANHTLLFDCMIYFKKGRRIGVCSNSFSPLPKAGLLSYSISLDQMNDAENIDNGVRALIKTFVVTGE